MTLQVFTLWGSGSLSKILKEQSQLRGRGGGLFSGGFIVLQIALRGHPLRNGCSETVL